MRQWTGSGFVQIMACRLVGTKLLSEPCWNIVNWTLVNKLQWNSNRNTKFFIHGNEFENVVCEIAAILSRGRWVEVQFQRLGWFSFQRQVWSYLYYRMDVFTEFCWMSITWHTSCDLWHYSDVTGASRHLKVLTIPLIIQKLVPGWQQEDSKVSHYNTLWNEIHCWTVDVPHKGPVMSEMWCHHCENTERVLMGSQCNDSLQITRGKFRPANIGEQSTMFQVTPQYLVF